MSLVWSLLGEIDGWLTGNAPETAATLRPPAAVDPVDQLRAGTGIEVHPDLVALLLWHDGAEATDVAAFQLAPGFDFLGAAEMIEVREREAAAAARFFPDSWRHGWLPVADDGAGGQLIMEHASGPAYGTVFARDPENGPSPDVRWPSLAALLADVAAALRDGTQLAGRLPEVEAGVLEWPDA